MEKASVKIALAGTHWKFLLQSGSLAHLPKGTVIHTAEKLIQVCNENGIRVENKDAILPKYAEALSL